VDEQHVQESGRESVIEIVRGFLGEMDMADVEIRRFEHGDETRTFEHGSFELVTIGGVTIGRASYEPGWIWSEHVGNASG
jgi:hypothetical protein